MSSRHDHFPRADLARIAELRAAAAAAAQAWRAQDEATGGLVAALRAQAGAAPGAAIDALAPWLDDTGWLAARLGEALALLRADPFARPPLRPVGGEALGGLLLGEADSIRLSLLVRPAGAQGPAAPAATFAPGRTRTRILASGGAAISFHHVAVTAGEEAGGFTAAAAGACTSDAPRPLAAGESIVLDGARTAFTLSGGRGDLVMLELAVQPSSPLPVRSYDVASGRLAHVSASRRDSSFRGMALTLLRLMRRTDAVPLFVAEAGGEDFAARWHAMRELVALDAPAAAAPLARMAAADPHPEVRAAAAATCALLVPAKPAPCRAR